MESNSPPPPSLESRLLDLRAKLGRGQPPPPEVGAWLMQVRTDLAKRAATPELVALWGLLGQIFEFQRNDDGTAAALEAYDHAIRVGGQLPEPRNPVVLRNLAVAWMHRGNLVQRRPEADAVKSAIEAYTQSIAHWERIQPVNTEVRTALAATWINRGSAWQKVNDASAAAPMAEAFARAADVLLPLPADANAHYLRLLSAAEINLAHVQLLTRQIEPQAAVEKVRTAAERMQGEATTDPVGADLVLRARRIACEAANLSLQQPTPPAGAVNWVSIGTDAAEDALALAGQWDKRGLTAFRPMVGWFFGFACMMYARFQPQFLGEFIVETLASERTPPDWKTAQPLRQTASDALEKTLEFLRGQKAGTVSPQIAPVVAALEETQQTLAALPPVQSAPPPGPSTITTN